MSLEEPPLDTIDESVRDTLYRDLRTIAIKLKYVLVPLKGSQEDTLKELRNCEWLDSLIHTPSLLRAALVASQRAHHSPLLPRHRILQCAPLHPPPQGISGGRCCFASCCRSC